MKIGVFRWLGEVLADPKLTPRDKTVAAGLIRHPWRDPPGYGRRHEDLGEDVALARSSVKRGASALIDAGYLDVIVPGHNGQIQVYRLTLPWLYDTE